MQWTKWSGESFLEDLDPGEGGDMEVEKEAEVKEVEYKGQLPGNCSSGMVT